MFVYTMSVRVFIFISSMAACQVDQLFPDSTYGGNTPDSGMDSSFLEASEATTPYSSQSSAQEASSVFHFTVPAYRGKLDAAAVADENDTELSHCLLHLLTLASSISSILRQSEYMVWCMHGYDCTSKYGLRCIAYKTRCSYMYNTCTFQITHTVYLYCMLR